MERRTFLEVLGGVGAVGVAGAGGWVARGGDSLHPVVTYPALEDRDMTGLGSGRAGRFGVHRMIWSARITEPYCALTFDDGPDPQFTPKVLEVLKSYGILGTFNVMGWNAVHHPDLLKEVIAAGHEIGNHSWSHLDMSTTNYLDTRNELVRGNEAIEETGGIKLKYFRPPRGELNGAAVRIAAELDLDLLLWSVTGSVPGYERPAQVRDFVLRNLAPGAIIDFHDGIGRGTFDRTGANARNLIERRTAELATLPQIIETSMHQGYSFLTVSGLLDKEQLPL